MCQMKKFQCDFIFKAIKYTSSYRVKLKVSLRNNNNDSN